MSQRMDDMDRMMEPMRQRIVRQEELLRELLAAAKGIQDVSKTYYMELNWATELEALDAAIAKAEG